MLTHICGCCVAGPNIKEPYGSELPAQKLVQHALSGVSLRDSTDAAGYLLLRSNESFGVRYKIWTSGIICMENVRRTVTALSMP